MIASRRGLAVLSAIAAALALVVVLEPPPSGRAGVRQVVTGLAVDRVARVVLERPSGRVAVERGEGGWLVTEPAPGPADGSVVADLLSAIAVARWDRAVPVAEAAGSGLEAPRLTVELGGEGGRRHRLAFGAAVAATGQIWARVDGGDALLVPPWLFTAVDRDVAALRQRRLAPIAPEQVTGLELHGAGDLVLSGAPLAVRGDGWSARPDPARVRALLEAIAGLTAVDVPAGPAPPMETSAGLTVRVLGGAAPIELAEQGDCREGLARVGGSAGDLCVDRSAWVAVAERAAALTGPPATWVDRRPVADDAAEIVWRRTGVTLRRRGGTAALISAAGEQPADMAAAGAALAALAAPASDVVSVTGDGDPVLDVRRPDGGTTTLSLVRTPDGPALRRDREPVALRVTTAALAALDRGVDDLRDRSLIAEEPTALARLVVRSGGREVVATRGVALGEWSGGDPAEIGAVAAALGDLRAERFAPAQALGGIRLTVEVTYDAPPVQGAATPRHVLEVGAAQGGGTCVARVDGQVAVLGATACRALTAMKP